MTRYLSPLRLIRKGPSLRTVAQEAIAAHRARLRVALATDLTHRLRWLKDPTRSLELGLCELCGGGASLAGGRESISTELLAPCPVAVRPFVACPWCEDFDRTDPRHAGISHSMCDACAAAWPNPEVAS